MFRSGALASLATERAWRAGFLRSRIQLEVRLPSNRIGRIESRRRGNRVDQLLAVNTCHTNLETTGEINATHTLPRPVTLP